MGTLQGTIHLTSPLATPIWNGKCTDIEVLAKGPSALTTKAGSDCKFTWHLPVGNYTLEYRIAGKSIGIGAPATVAMRKGETVNVSQNVSFPTVPVVNIKVAIDITGAANSGLNCSQIRVTVAHALITFDELATGASGKCAASFSNTPVGPVTVSISGGNQVPPPSQSITGVEGVSPTVSFAYPKNATVILRLRPSDYPTAHSPAFNCAPYEMVLSAPGWPGLTAHTTPGYYTATECTMETPQQVPSGVPITFQLKKNGAVVQTETIGPLPALQTVTKVVQPMP